MKNIKVSRKSGRYLRQWKNYQEEFRGYLGLDSELTLENAAELADLDTGEKCHTTISTARHMAKLMMLTKDPANDKCAIDKFIDAVLATRAGAFLARMVNYRHYVGVPTFAK